MPAGFTKARGGGRDDPELDERLKWLGEEKVRHVKLLRAMAAER